MAEYIEREALYKKVSKRIKNAVIVSWLCAMIAEEPAADVVEVCRCQNCIHSKYFEESGIRNCLNSKGFYRTVTDNDFCSYGERRSE